eukprot:10891-Chlamydomonas_euryale.AAC.2
MLCGAEVPFPFAGSYSRPPQRARPAWLACTSPHRGEVPAAAVERENTAVQRIIPVHTDAHLGCALEGSLQEAPAAAATAGREKGWGGNDGRGRALATRARCGGGGGGTGGGGGGLLARQQWVATGGGKVAKRARGAAARHGGGPGALPTGLGGADTWAATWAAQGLKA